MTIVILFEVAIIFFLLGLLYYFSQYAIVQFNNNTKNEKFQRELCEIIDKNYKKLEEAIKSNDEFENKIYNMLEENFKKEEEIFNKLGK